MALEFFTGFEGCGSTADMLAILSTGGGTYSATNGYNNGKSYYSTNNWGPGKVCIGGATKVLGWHIRNAGIYSGYNASYLQHALCYFVGPEISLWNHDAGRITIYRGTTYIGEIAGIISSALTHVQVKLYSHISAGYVEVYKDGVLHGSVTGVNTGGQNITRLVVGVTGGSVYIDNMYISDTVEGELISKLCKPSSDSAVQFTPLSGVSNYLMVDDPNQDADTTYVESSTVGHQDLYGFEDVPAGYLVKAVSLVAVARKDDVGIRTLQLRADQDATEYNIGSAIALSTEYPIALSTGSPKVVLLAPDGTAWTLAKFNACTWGFKVAS